MFTRNLRFGLVLMLPLALLACGKQEPASKTDAVKEKFGAFVDTAKKDGEEVLDKGKDLAAETGDAIKANAEAGWKKLGDGCDDLKAKSKTASADAKVEMNKLADSFEKRSADLRKDWDDLAQKTGESADKGRAKIAKSIAELNIEFEKAKAKYF